MNALPESSVPRQLGRPSRALIILALLSGGPSRGQDSPAPARPNVLFVSIDDLNDWIEPLGGHPQARTPNLVRLASESVNFTRAYTPSPGCNPARTAVMTGRAPYRSGVYSNYQDWRELLPDVTCLGRHYREHGYSTAGAGKIFHYHMVDPGSWDEYWPSQERNMPADVMPDMALSPLRAQGGPVPETMHMPAFPRMYGMFDWHALDIEDDGMGDARSVQFVIDRLGEQRDEPFFLACGIYRPHLPWYAPQQYFDLFPVDDIQLPRVLEGDLDDVGERVKDIAERGGGYHRHVLEAGQWKAAVQGYLASIAFADAMLGRLLDALEQSGHADDTVVVVWSDHGWQLGEKEHWRKFALWENVLHSVLMIRAPRATPGLAEGSRDGTACDRVVSLQDIYPTLVDLCGLPRRKEVDGRSLVPLLRDPESDWPYPAVSTYDHGEFSIRDERWRYTRYIDGSEELYDHDADPEEWHNLAGEAEYAEVERTLAAHIPSEPAALVKTSEPLQAHHIPPFRSRVEYLEWLEHDKDTLYMIEKYWQ